MNKAEVIKQATILSICFQVGYKIEMTREEMIILFALGRLKGEAAGYDLLHLYTGIPQSSIKIKGGAMKLLLERKLVEVTQEKRHTTKAHVFTMTSTGWEVLHNLIIQK